MRLHLVLKHHWYDKTREGLKRIEYREMTPLWKKLIWKRRSEITHVRFARGYTKQMMTYEVNKIDVGPCPIKGWDGEYYRIHFGGGRKAEEAQYRLNERAERFSIL